MLATLLRGPSFTLAIASCFRGVALHITALAVATASSRIAGRTAEPQQLRVRAALEAVALIRLLDITPQALRWHPKHAVKWLMIWCSSALIIIPAAAPHTLKTLTCADVLRPRQTCAYQPSS